MDFCQEIVVEMACSSAFPGAPSQVSIVSIEDVIALLPEYEALRKKSDSDRVRCSKSRPAPLVAVCK